MFACMYYSACMYVCVLAAIRLHTHSLSLSPLCMYACMCVVSAEIINKFSLKEAITEQLSKEIAQKKETVEKFKKEKVHTYIHACIHTHTYMRYMVSYQ